MTTAERFQFLTARMDHQAHEIAKLQETTQALRELLDLSHANDNVLGARIDSSNRHRELLTGRVDSLVRQVEKLELLAAIDDMAAAVLDDEPQTTEIKR